MKWSKNLNFELKIWTEKNFEQKKIFEKKNFLGSNMYQAKSGVKKFSPLVGGGGGGSPQKQVAQNELKHILVLEFLRYDHFLGGGSEKLTGQQASKQTSRQTSGHHSDQISRSALRDGATKKQILFSYLIFLWYGF